jgi:hypothetical protein
MTDDSDSTFEEIEFEEIDDTRDRHKPDTLAHTMMNFLSATHVKLLIAIYALFLFVSSDVFIDKVLSRVSGAVNNRMPNTKGVLIQGAILIVFVMIIELILRMGFP